MSATTSSPADSLHTGQLRIGDEWNAISILAQSQTHPLKAVCEFTENAIDAGATQIEIVRRREEGEVVLEVHDNGRGVSLLENGEPNFLHIATHLCDSMKRRLVDRKGVHGEYGIGLLSFWSIGNQLQMISHAADGTPRELFLERSRPDYKIGRLRNHMGFGLGGTSLIVSPLLDSTRNTLTGDKLQRYLSAELRDRIRSTGVEIRIVDKVSRKQLDVRPREFEGQRLELPGHLVTDRGEVRVELYVCPPGMPADVALCKDGTRVFTSITQLDPFQKAPWTDGKLQGVIDCPFINLAPGNRSGVVPDENLTCLIEALATVESQVVDAIADQERVAAEEVSAQTLKQVQKAFLSALRDLPDNEYLYFDIPKPNKPKAAEDELVGQAVSSYARSTTQLDGNVRLFPLMPGPLAAIATSPRNPRRQPGQTLSLTAQATDVRGIPINDGIKYKWKVRQGAGEIVSGDGPTCELTSAAAGIVVLSVSAKQGAEKVKAEVQVKFSPVPVPVNRGLPTYRFEADPNSMARSRYEEPANEIVMNAAHPDFLESRSGTARHRRYIGKLYAKEVVLLNFPHESPAVVAERLIEVMVRTEENL
jgi:hypothetical protein